MSYSSSPFLLVLIVVCFHTGCGVGSIYGPAYYSDTEVGVDVRRVTFRGGDHPLTGDLCLLRCAEITLDSGYFYFQVVDSETGSSIDQLPSAYPFHRHYPMDDPFLRDIAFVTKTIRMLKTEDDEEFCYNAGYVQRSMKAKYDLK